MSQYTEGPTKGTTAAGAIAQFLRVKTMGALVVAGATDVEVGTMELPAFAANEPATVRLRTAGGTCKMVASEAITANTTVYAAAGGKVAATGSVVVGQALEAATGDGSILEVLRHADTAEPWGTQTITADDSESALNTILPGVNSVTVDGVTNDANDFIVLPSLADVEDGSRILVIGSGSSNFEVRTPADSDEEINSENSDGTNEYLFTDTQLHYFVKIDGTIGWMAHGYSAIGAVVTAVVPD